MQIKFDANLENGEAKISDGTVADLASLAPLLRADILKDVVFDATNAYNDALAEMRMQWEANRDGQTAH